MGQLIITYNDARCASNNNIANYTTAHNAATSTDLYNAQSAEVGQRVQGGYYFIERAWARFNLATIPAGSVVTGVQLKGRSYFNTQNPAFTIIIVDATGAISDVSDYGLLLASTTTLGSLASADITVNVTWTITLNATGIALAQANIGGYVYYGFRTDREIALTSMGQLDTH
jgi:hypothetical protein